MLETSKDLLNGRIPLVKTYWLYGVVTFIITNIFLRLSLPYLVQQAYLSGSLFYVIVYYLLVVLATCYYFVIVIAVWRSATRYQGREIWSILARISVFLGLIRSIPEIFALLGF